MAAGSLQSPLSQNAPYKGQIKGKKEIYKGQIWGKYEAKKGQMKNNSLVKMVVLNTKIYQLTILQKDAARIMGALYNNTISK